MLRRFFRFLFSLIFLLTSIGIYFTNRIMYMKKKEEAFIFKREKEAGRFNPLKFKILPKREILISSPLGYLLKTVVIEPHHTNRYIIFSHGVTENKVNSIKYMNLFLERGFNAVIYDHRRHGESGGKTTSFGHFEKFDLKAIVDWLKQDQGPNLFFGIHGESMGAATMLMYAGMLEDAANFYIADCPFSDFKEQLAHVLKADMKLPPKLFLPVASLFLRIRERYSLRDISPISVIENIHHPILFIHSQKDDYILPSMTEALYERKKGAKKLYMAANGVHAQSFNENKEDYEKIVDEFLYEYVFQPSLYV